MKSIVVIFSAVALVMAVAMLAGILTYHEPRLSNRGAMPSIKRWIELHGNCRSDGSRWPDEDIRIIYSNNPRRAEELIRSETPHYTRAELQRFLAEMECTKYERNAR